MRRRPKQADMASKLDELTERELLILLNAKVTHIEALLDGHVKELIELRLKVRELETKVVLYAAFGSLLTSGVVSFLISIISK